MFENLFSPLTLTPSQNPSIAPMKIARVEADGKPQWAALEGQTFHLLGSMAGVRTGRSVPLEGAKLFVPAEPSKIVCVGRNYVEHIRELGNDKNGLPNEPGIFLKGPNTLLPSGSSVEHPTWTNELHFEGELALVIGKKARGLTVDNALEHVFGYTCALDLTARDVQKTDLQWARAKGADGFCPLGPLLETDFDPLNVQVTTRVNGTVRQDASSELMIFDVPTILAYISSFVTLEAGDVVLTGTPAGVGKLERGDFVEVEVAEVGVLEVSIA